MTDGPARDPRRAGRLSIAIAELRSGGNRWCYEHWFPGRSLASLEDELLALDVADLAEALEPHVWTGRA